MIKPPYSVREQVMSSPFILEKKNSLFLSQKANLKTPSPTWGIALADKIVNKIREENQTSNKPKIPAARFHQIYVKCEL